MSKKRLSDFVKVSKDKEPRESLLIKTRSQTGKGCLFGSESKVFLSSEEAKELKEFLNTHY